MTKYFVGCDVGTGSARAGLFDASGTLLASASKDIQTWSAGADIAEQSSADIWAKLSACVREVVAGVPAEAVAGIGFDATCSLVVVGANDDPVTVSEGGDDAQNIILWADHRAIPQADEIDATGHERLRVSGGTISPEMQLPKLKWLKTHLPESWARAAHFFDLPDWLTYRASGNLTRSLCSTVCKWTYRGEAPQGTSGWDRAFFTEIGLAELSDRQFARIGSKMAHPGASLGGLTAEAARDLNLTTQTQVATSMIDAHAGALGTFGVGLQTDDFSGRMALIAGTSACHISLSNEASHVPGVWGPYFGAVMPDLWVNEAGQSMAGAAIDTVIARHSAADHAAKAADSTGVDIHDYLAQHLTSLANGGPVHDLTRDRHIQPDFAGNRAPLADPTRRGMTIGQGSTSGIDDLAIDYLACIQSLAYGTRHILDVQRQNGLHIDTILVSGGLARNALYVAAHADATGCDVMIPDQREPVLLGAAMLAAVGAATYANLPIAMRRMSGAGTTITPDPISAQYHARKYQVYRKMLDDFATYRSYMQPETSQ